MGRVPEVEDSMREVMKLFLEMKDTSELMVDLAYSSLLYNNKDIAAEVEHLGDQVDEMSGQLKRLSVETMSSKSTDATLMLLRMDSFVNAIADSANSICDVVLRDIEPHPVLKESIVESDVGIFRVEIGQKSILVCKELRDIRLATETGMWAIAIKRGTKWIYGPESDQDVQAGDVIFVKGPPDSMKKMRKLASGRLRKL